MIDSREAEARALDTLRRARVRYLAKVGSLFVVGRRGLADLQDSAEAARRDGMPLLEGFAEELSKRFNDAPFVSSVLRAPDRDDPCAIIPVHTDEATGYAPEYFVPFVLRVHWPRKNQDVPSWYTGEVIEDFVIAYSGFAFACLGRVSDQLDAPYSFEFGREAIKVLETALAPSDKWVITRMGPTPMHPDFYLAYLPDEGLPSPAVQTLGDDVVAFLRFRSDDACLDDSVSYLESGMPAVRSFYESLLTRSEFLTSVEKLFGGFSELAELHKELLALSVWNPRAIPSRLSTIRRMRTLLMQTYETHVELTEQRSALTEDLRWVREHFSRTAFLAPVLPYVEEMTSDVFAMDVSHILQAVRFLEEECRSASNQRAAIDAAAIGAVVGGAVGAVLSRVFS